MFQSIGFWFKSPTLYNEKLITTTNSSQRGICYQKGKKNWIKNVQKWLILPFPLKRDLFMLFKRFQIFGIFCDNQQNAFSLHANVIDAYNFIQHTNVVRSVVKRAQNKTQQQNLKRNMFFHPPPLSFPRQRKETQKLGPSSRPSYVVHVHNIIN